VIERFVAKVVEVTGIVWDGTNFEEIRQFCNGLAHTKRLNGDTVLFIETTEGTSRARIGDTIIMGTQGEFYPVKPEVMAAKYDRKS
jgi:hypothetical protein